MNILMLGDSITDAGRDRSDPLQLGNGYAKDVAEILQKRYPNLPLEIRNRGIGGSRTGTLLERLKKDLTGFDADIISVGVGINDIWHRHFDPVNFVLTSDEEIREHLETILKIIRRQTSAKIILLEPFQLTSPHHSLVLWREELDRVIQIERQLGRIYADRYLPLDGILAEKEIEIGGIYPLSEDGIHPNPAGAKIIAESYVQAMEAWLPFGKEKKG